MSEKGQGKIFFLVRENSSLFTSVATVKASEKSFFLPDSVFSSNHQTQH